LTFRIAAILLMTHSRMGNKSSLAALAPLLHISSTPVDMEKHRRKSARINRKGLLDCKKRIGTNRIRGGSLFR
jgi:hypothetical protein